MQNNTIAQTLSHASDEKLDEIFDMMRRYRHEQTVENILTSIEEWGDVDHIRKDVFSTRNKIRMIRDLVRLGVDEEVAYDFGWRTCLSWYSREEVCGQKDDPLSTLFITDLIKDAKMTMEDAVHIARHIRIFDYVRRRRY